MRAEAKPHDPDNWPGRWATKALILSQPNYDWDNFRRDSALMAGIQTRPSRLDYWMRQCERDGVPHAVMVDSHLGNPVGREMPWGFVTASSCKHAWYAWRVSVRSLHFEHSPFRLSFPELSMLEIGGGYGGLARALSIELSVKSVAFIDAPPCLMIQETYLRSLGPVVSVRRHQDENVYDLVTNTMSFGEMPYAQVKTYFGIIQRQLRDGGVFFTANRLHRVTNFAAYPYDGGWHHEVSYMPNEGKALMAKGYVMCYSVRDRSAKSPHPATMLT